MFQEVIEKIYIRPIRQKYYAYDLGPKYCTFDPDIHENKRKKYHNLSGRSNRNSRSETTRQLKQPFTTRNVKKIKRQDHKIHSPNTQQLHVSFYKAQSISTVQNSSQKSKPNHEPQTTLVYLHTHNGSKLQGLSLVQPILSIGINFCIFDFSGYGNSRGENVSLGIKQIYDLQTVLRFLEEEYDQVGFMLWGRSMGAVTALKYLSSDSHKNQQFNILAAIYDSPFASIEQLTFQMSSKNLNLPQTLLTPLVLLIKSALREKLPFQQLDLQNQMKNIDVPCIFIASKNDSFISYEHSQKLYTNYNCREKQILFIERNHNQTRTNQDLLKIFCFIQHIHHRNYKKEHIVIENIAKRK